MGNNRTVSETVRHLYRFESFCQGSDLIHLYKDRIGSIQADATVQPLFIGHKEIVSHQLYPVSKPPGHLRPAFPVLFFQTIFNRNNREAIQQVFIICNHLCGCPHNLISLHPALPGKIVPFPVLIIQFTCRRINGKYHIASRCVSCVFNRFCQKFQHLFRAFQIRRETALITDRGRQPLVF